MTPETGAGGSGEGEQRGQPCRCYPSLPEAIAPSLASTPTFARRNTSWCHALEVCFCVSFGVFFLGAERYCNLPQRCFKETKNLLSEFFKTASGVYSGSKRFFCYFISGNVMLNSYIKIGTKRKLGDVPMNICGNQNYFHIDR